MSCSVSRLGSSASELRERMREGEQGNLSRYPRHILSVDNDVESPQSRVQAGILTRLAGVVGPLNLLSGYGKYRIRQGPSSEPPPPVPAYPSNTAPTP